MGNWPRNFLKTSFRIKVKAPLSLSGGNTELPSEFIAASVDLKKGETTGLVESSAGLHIIRGVDSDGETVEVQHILFRYFGINKYLKQQLEQAEHKEYIQLPEPDPQEES